MTNDGLYRRIKIRRHKTYESFVKDYWGIDNNFIKAISVPIINYLVITVFMLVCPVAYIYDYDIRYIKVKK